ncbi:MAG: hypothetical protein WCJ33_01285 [Pseudomonadota bacterium]
MKKQELPSIENELKPIPRTKVDFAKLKSREVTEDVSVEANSHKIGTKWGATTQLPANEPTINLAPLTSIRGYIPQYLDNELSVKAATRRVTKTFLIMEALSKAGYKVDDIDLIQDRRKPTIKSN